MGARKTTEQFIEDAKAVHGDKYDYSLTAYSGYNNKIKVICSIHGVFETQARCHLKSNCSKCTYTERTTTFKEFVEKANNVHINKYTYDESSYTNTNNKLNIFCEQHGWYKQTGHQHLAGQKCAKCSLIISSNKLRHTQEEFLSRAIELHGDKYNYDKVEYKNSNIRVTIWCNTCKKYFQQIASTHLRHGCKACADKNNGITLRKTNEEYVNNVSVIHNNFYTYEKTEYIKIGEKITVTCPIHGDFIIRASDHITGCGCTFCSKEMQKYNGWSDTNWIKFGNISKNFVAFQVYLIKCTDVKTKEIFYKIGKTYIAIKYRFSGKVLPYSYEIIKVIKGDGLEISKLERELHKKYKEFKYKPKKEFGGFLECYTTQLPLEEIINIKG